jgi:hypothetical protein
MRYFHSSSFGRAGEVLLVSRAGGCTHRLDLCLGWVGESPDLQGEFIPDTVAERHVRQVAALELPARCELSGPQPLAGGPLRD